MLTPKLQAVAHAHLGGQLTLREATMLQNHYAPVRRWRKPTQTLWGVPVRTNSSLPPGLVVLHHGKTVWPPASRPPWAYLDSGGVTYEDRGDGLGWRRVWLGGATITGVDWQEGAPVQVGTPWYADMEAVYAKTFAGQMAQARKAVHNLLRALCRR